MEEVWVSPSLDDQLLSLFLRGRRVNRSIFALLEDSES